MSSSIPSPPALQPQPHHALEDDNVPPAKTITYQKHIQTLESLADDNSDLPTLVFAACTILAQEFLSLLLSLQRVPRDAVEFTPIVGIENKDIVEEGDAALLLLMALCDVAETRRNASGWYAKADGSVAGATLYQNRKSKKCLETGSITSLLLNDRVFNGGKICHDHERVKGMEDVLMTLPLFVAPVSLDGKTVTWAVEVVDAIFGSDGMDKMSVLDVVKVEEMMDDDEDTTSSYTSSQTSKRRNHRKENCNSNSSITIMRGLYNSSYTGFCHLPVAEMCIPKSGTGRKRKPISDVAAFPPLESFVHTTVCGMVLGYANTAPKMRILVLSLGIATIPAFLSLALPTSTIKICELNQSIVNLQKYFYFTGTTGSSTTRENCEIVTRWEDVNNVLADEGEKLYDVLVIEAGWDWGAVGCGCVNDLHGVLSEKALVLVVGDTSAADKSMQNSTNATELEKLFGRGKVLLEEMLREDDEENDTEEEVSSSPSPKPKPEPCVTMYNSPVEEITVENWSRNTKSIQTGAMPVKTAQLQQVQRFPSLISSQELENIRTQSGLARDRGAGIEVRSGVGQVGSDGEPLWHVTHLTTNNLFVELLPSCRALLLQKAREADASNNWGLLADLTDEQIHVRVAEFHKYSSGGGLPDKKHYDLDSLITVDCMVSSCSDFTGGDFQTLEMRENGMEELITHTFDRGDVVFFVSHKFHCVQPVTSGTRNVLVVEFWKGGEKTCPHRCEVFRGRCKFDKRDAKCCEVNDGEEEENSNLPFRLGSSVCQGGANPNNWRLLWQPANKEAVSTKEEEKIDVALAAVTEDDDEEDAEEWWDI